MLNSTVYKMYACRNAPSSSASNEEIVGDLFPGVILQRV